LPHWPEIFQETIPPDLRVKFIPGVIGFTNW